MPHAESIQSLKKTKPSRRGRPSTAESAEQRERIVATAQAHFIRNGYSKTTMEGIANSAKITKQTLYAQHNDKRTLFFRVIERFRDPRANVAAFMDQHPDISFEEGLQQLAVRILSAAHTPRSLALHKLVQREAHKFPELAEMFTDLNERGIFKPLENYMQRGKKAGHLAGISPREAAQWFIYLVFGEFLRRAIMQVKPAAPREIKAHATTAVKFFLNGVRRAP